MIALIYGFLAICAVLILGRFAADLIAGTLGIFATIYRAGTPEARPRHLYPTADDCGISPRMHRDH